MFTGSHPELSQKSLQIKQDEKFFSRVLSKESSVANPSLRVYYGGVTGAVPFMWESQPGTPKHPLSDTTPPPLTPPPSFYCKSKKKPIKKHSRSDLLHALFLKFNLKRINLSLSSLPSFSSTSSSRSSPDSSVFPPASPKSYHHRRRRQFSSTSSSLDSMGDDEEEDDAGGSPTSILCFGTRRLRGCY